MPFLCWVCNSLTRCMAEFGINCQVSFHRQEAGTASLQHLTESRAAQTPSSTTVLHHLRWHHTTPHHTTQPCFIIILQMYMIYRWYQSVSYQYPVLTWTTVFLIECFQRYFGNIFKVQNEVSVNWTNGPYFKHGKYL